MGAADSVEGILEAVAIVVAVIAILLSMLVPVMLSWLRQVEEARAAYERSRKADTVAKLLQAQYAAYRRSRLRPSYVPKDAPGELIAQRRVQDVARAFQVHIRSLEIGALLVRLESSNSQLIAATCQDLLNEVNLDKQGEWSGYLRLYIAILMDSDAYERADRRALERLKEQCRAPEPTLALATDFNGGWRRGAFQAGVMAIVTFFCGIGIFAAISFVLF